MRPTTTPTIRPTTSSPPASAYSAVGGSMIGAAMFAVVDELPTATVCEPAVGKMYVKVTVALPSAVRLTLWTATGALSTNNVTGTEPATLNVFVTVASIVDAVPATFASTVGVPYVTT